MINYKSLLTNVKIINIDSKEDVMSVVLHIRVQILTKCLVMNFLMLKIVILSINNNYFFIEKVILVLITLMFVINLD